MASIPFKSEAQRKYMYEKHPAVAKQWQGETPPGKLPNRVGPKKKTAPRKGASKRKR